MISPIDKASELVRQWNGALSRELTLSPGGFGLGKVPDRLKPDATTSMVCGYCSTGCGLKIHLRDGVAVGLTPETEYPVNLGMACPKGWEALAVLQSPERATTPLLRDGTGNLAPVGWHTALTEFTQRIKAVQAKHGTESVAFIGTGQIPTEELAFLGSLAKFGMGILHGDGNTRQCMATAVTAYKQSFGFDAPPYTYRDLEQSDVIVLIGSNLCIAHPILWERVLRNQNNPKIIVIDPRKTETAAAATTHLQLQPKSDLTLFYGLAHLLIANDWVDRDFISAHTNDFAGFAEFAAAFTPERVADVTGVSVEQLRATAEIIHKGARVSFWWTMGVNQSHEGTRTAQAIINLALLTGNIGRPGTGANSITGQCNAMGSRLFSNTTTLLGGREFTNAAHRSEVAALLNLDPARIPDRNSLSYYEIIDHIRTGKIKALWIVATNSAHSWINQNDLRETLKKLDFLAVQDMYHSTETAALADLVLPAAGWGEKEGTFINSERRFGALKKVAKAPGLALADFSIFKLIAHYWGCAEMFAAWETPEAVFKLLTRLSAGRPCDFSGIRDYKMLDEHNGIQWPLPAGTTSFEQERRLFADGKFFHSDGRAKFIFQPPRADPEPRDGSYPFMLLTGRGSVAQWHTQTRTRQSAQLRQLYPQEVYVEINPADARTLGIKPGEKVLIESRRGRMSAAAFPTHQVRRGQLFLPMHYAAVNRLTNPAFDPYSKQPSYKSSAVRIRRAETHEHEVTHD